MITEILHKQTKHSYHWLNKIIEDIPENKWELTPEKIETNIVWQIGHLIVSINYHSIIVINGQPIDCLLYTSPSPRDLSTSRMPSSA